MKILVACEESQAVTVELRALGHEAYSCDILPTSGEHPEWHLQQDVLPILSESWDMIIAFPPCTHLTNAGACRWKEKQRSGEQEAAIKFFMEFANCGCPKIAIENPLGIMSTVYRKPDQIIQPYYFGDEARKRTCLWLRGLPKLTPTNIVGQGELYEITRKSGPRAGRKYVAPAWYQALSRLPPDIRSRLRSKTFPGIAKAMAEQWTQCRCDSGSGVNI